MNGLRRIFGRRANEMKEPAYGITDVGRHRDINQDCYLLLPEMDIYIVADGMGGHTAGEVASLNAVEAVGEYFTPERTREMKSDTGKINEEMISAVIKAHERIAGISKAKKEYTGMGSTIVVSFIDGNMLHTCHVGDSRVYVINPYSIRQVTNDHSTVAELVRLGEMTREEARHSPRKNEITQALGAPIPVRPECNQHVLHKGDVVLLCSDGLWEMLSDEEIQNIVVERKTVEGACRKLTEQANAAGGNDNITVVLVEVSGDDDVSSTVPR